MYKRRTVPKIIGEICTPKRGQVCDLHVDKGTCYWLDMIQHAILCNFMHLVSLNKLLIFGFVVEFHQGVLLLIATLLLDGVSLHTFPSDPKYQ